MQRNNLLESNYKYANSKKGTKKMKENKQNYLEAQDLYDEYKKSVEND